MRKAHLQEATTISLLFVMNSLYLLIYFCFLDTSPPIHHRLCRRYEVYGDVYAFSFIFLNQILQRAIYNMTPNSSISTT
jgi:hypothetical protein